MFLENRKKQDETKMKTNITILQKNTISEFRITGFSVMLLVLWDY